MNKKAKLILGGVSIASLAVVVPFAVVSCSSQTPATTSATSSNKFVAPTSIRNTFPTSLQLNKTQTVNFTIPNGWVLKQLISSDSSLLAVSHVTSSSCVLTALKLGAAYISLEIAYQTSSGPTKSYSYLVTVVKDAVSSKTSSTPISKSANKKPVSSTSKTTAAIKWTDTNPITNLNAQTDYFLGKYLFQINQVPNWKVESITYGSEPLKLNNSGKYTLTTKANVSTLKILFESDSAPQATHLATINLQIIPITQETVNRVIQTLKNDAKKTKSMGELYLFNFGNIYNILSKEWKFTNCLALKSSKIYTAKNLQYEPNTVDIVFSAANVYRGIFSFTFSNGKQSFTLSNIVLTFLGN